MIMMEADYQSIQINAWQAAVIADFLYQVVAPTTFY
jgi:hypothetical protein